MVSACASMTALRRQATPQWHHRQGQGRSAMVLAPTVHLPPSLWGRDARTSCTTRVVREPRLFTTPHPPPALFLPTHCTHQRHTGATGQLATATSINNDTRVVPREQARLVGKPSHGSSGSARVAWPPHGRRQWHAPQAGAARRHTTAPAPPDGARRRRRAPWRR